jgi:hypothetical protein
MGQPRIRDLRNYKGRFAFPNPQTSPNAPGPGCCGEDWSWFDAGGVRFIAYPEPFTGAWSDWQAKADPIMAAAQADPSIHFIVTAGHRPAYSTGNHAGSSSLAAILDGFGDKYSKYLVNFNGHSHDYERFHPIHRVTHITAAGGGATLEAPWQTTDPRTAYRAMHLEHVRVDVTASSMRIEAVCGPPTPDDDITCTRGEVIDSVTIMSPGTPPPGNQAPVVNAGADQSVVLPGTASLSGSVTDDGLPNPPGTVTTLWSKLSGPGTVSFANASAKSTTASFSSPGTYVLRLTANDSALTAADDLTVQVAAAGSSQAIDVAVAASSDDAEERGSSVDLASSDLELVTDGTTVQTVGLRFPGVAVPRGAVIQDAYVQFQTDEVSTDTASLTVQGQAADTAATFTTATRNVSSRPRTTASVGWTPPGWPTVDARGVDQRTPNLAPVVQEIINRTGWTSGNGLALIITGTGRRTAEAYDGTRAPTLHIQYSS